MVVARSKPFIRRRHKTRHQVDKSSSHYHNLHTILMSPVLAIDLCISSILWLQTMVFQFSLYGLYLGLFLLVVCPSSLDLALVWLITEE